MKYVVYDDYNEIWEVHEASSPEEAAEAHGEAFSYEENTDFTVYEISDEVRIRVEEELSTNFVRQ